MRKTTRLTALLTALLLTLSLAACGGSAPPSAAPAEPAASSETPGASSEPPADGEQITLEVTHYFELQDGDRFKEMCESYNSVNPNVKVNVTFITRADLLKQYTMGALSGELPDVGMVDNPDHASFSAMGAFLDITDLVGQDELGNFFEGPLASCMYEGRLYGLPNNSNCLAIFINNTMFEAAGVTPPTTWDELMAAAEKLTDPANGVYGFTMSARNNEEGTFQYMPFLLSSGAALDDLDSEGAVRSLKFLTDMLNNGYMSQDVINWGQADINTQFISGKAAMQLNGPWNVPQIAQEAPELDYSCIIVPKDVKNASVLGGENFAVGASTEYPEAAVEFLKWMNSPQVMADFCEAAGKFPPRSDAITLKAIWTDDPIYSVFAEQMEYAMPRGPHPRWPEISTAISTALTESLTGVKDPQTALTEAAQKYDALIAG